ncbi:MAG: sugar ABC transporter ATP-binding protein [Gemmatimonadota bacterium]
MRERPQPRLVMRGIGRRFGATVALEHVDLAVCAGQVHALLGENGAGKSTLMRILAGALAPDAGEIHLEGEPFRPRGPLEARAAGIATVYQEPSLAPHLTVADNLVLGVEPVRRGLLDRRAARRRAAAALDQVQHPEIRLDDRVGDLPLAARQLVEIARALVLDCRVLVLDEPTSSLTADDVERLFGLIRQLRDRGLAIVYISHFLEEVQQVADRFTVLRDGRAAGQGAVAGTAISVLVGMMVGRQLEALFPRSPRPRGEAILEVEALASGTRVLGAGFTLRRGEVLGLAGLVGAGRTELLRALFGLAPVRSGRIRLGAYLGPASPARRLAQGMGLLSEDRKGEGLAPGLSVADNLTLSRLPGPAGLVLPSRQRQAAASWIRRLDIRCRGPGQPVRELSGGNQQKVALGRLLHADVDVLLLDEPTRGVDVGSKAQIYQLVDDLAARQGKAVVLVSSYLPELLGVCDRVAVMCRGRLGPPRPARDLDQRAVLLEATGQETP